MADKNTRRLRDDLERTRRRIIREAPMTLARNLAHDLRSGRGRWPVKSGRSRRGFKAVSLGRGRAALVNRQFYAVFHRQIAKRHLRANLRRYMRKIELEVR